MKTLREVAGAAFFVVVFLVGLRLAGAFVFSAPKSVGWSLAKTQQQVSVAMDKGDLKAALLAAALPPAPSTPAPDHEIRDAEFYKSVWPSEVYAVVPSPYRPSQASGVPDGVDLVTRLNAVLEQHPGESLESVRAGRLDSEYWVLSGRMKTAVGRQHFEYFRIPPELRAQVVAGGEPENVVLEAIAAWKAADPQRKAATVVYSIALPTAFIPKYGAYEEMNTPVGMVFLLEMP